MFSKQVSAYLNRPLGLRQAPSQIPWCRPRRRPRWWMFSPPMRHAPGSTSQPVLWEIRLAYGPTACLRKEGGYNIPGTEPLPQWSCLMFQYNCTLRLTAYIKNTPPSQFPAKYNRPGVFEILFDFLNNTIFYKERFRLRKNVLIQEKKISTQFACYLGGINNTSSHQILIIPCSGIVAVPEVVVHKDLSIDKLQISYAQDSKY